MAVLSVQLSTLSVAEQEALLALNEHNRNLRPAHEAELASDMAEGYWVNGIADVSVYVTPDGVPRLLLDGQHVLTAAVAQGKPVTVTMKYHDNPADQMVIDRNLRRALHEQLKLEGERYSTNLAAAAHWLWRLNLVHRGLGYVKSVPSPRAGYAVWQANAPGLRLAVRAVHETSVVLAVPSGVAAALYHLMRTRGGGGGVLDPAAAAAEADHFWRSLATGENLPPLSPLLYLRRKLLANARTRPRVLNGPAIAALLVVAWNMYLRGEDVDPKRGLTWRGGGRNPERFPVMLLGLEPEAGAREELDLELEEVR